MAPPKAGKRERDPFEAPAVLPKPKKKRILKRCSIADCTKIARKGGKCIAHGGGRRCTEPGCTKGATGKTDKCIQHGGGKRCAEAGCTNSAIGKTDKCAQHGGGKRCTEPGCNKSARGKIDKCKAHGGGKRCTEPGCNKSAQGTTDFCKAHGGGKRCKTKGCTKSARGKTDFCVTHGGGKRCKTKGCTKGARGKTDHCRAHGGGKRCVHEECTNSAMGKTDFCRTHGGGKRCKTKGCTKGAEGKTDHCISHGGGRRCSRLDVHQFEGTPPVMYASVEGADLCYNCFCHLHPERLARWSVRREHIFLAELQRRAPVLARDALHVVWDCNVGGCSRYRPDMMFDFVRWYLHVEFDEDLEHEDNRDRLRVVAQDMAHHTGLVLRVQGEGMFTRQRMSGEYRWRGSRRFVARMDAVEAWVRERVIPYVADGVGMANPHAGPPGSPRVFLV